MGTSSRTDRSSTHRRPPNTEIPTVTWLVSRRGWLLTLGLYVAVVVLVAVLGALRHGAPFVETLVHAATRPVPALAAFLGARGLALLAVQRHRDAAVATGSISVTDDTSLGALLTVASFSMVGLVATAIALPILYTASRVAFQLLAAAVAVLVVPASYLLLAYQVGELLSADRYRRGYAVQPAVWQFAWTLPLVVLAWTLVSGHALTVPAGLSPTGSAVRLDAWTTTFVAACAPTTVALAYAVRRQVERVARGLTP